MEEAHALGEFPLDVREEGEALEEGVEGVKLGGKRPFGLLGLAVVRKEVPVGAEVEGGGGRYRVEALPFKEAAWSGQRSSG